MHLPSPRTALVALLLLVHACTPTTPGDSSELDAGPLDGGSDAGDDEGAATRGPGRICDYDEECLEDESGRRCIEGGCGCRADRDCSEQPGGRTVCDTRSLSCVECTSSEQCSDGTPICIEGSCRACREDADCPSHRPFCSAESCLVCLEDDHCASDDRGLRCIARTCGCETNADCPAGRACEESRCVPGCTSNADCSDGWREVCETDTGLCRRCLTDDDCVRLEDGYGAHCLIPNYGCGCTEDAHCASSTAGHACMTAIGICGCNTNDDCPPEWPSCIGNTCRR